MAANVGKMQEEALKRKERLKNMRMKQNKDGAGEDEPQAKIGAAEGEDSLPKPVFRSYKPQDQQLKENTLPQPLPVKVEENIQEQLESAKPEPLVEEVDLVNLAPRKPDWDLKRDVSKKLAKLEKRTQRAIAELIRERLQSGNEDLAAVVSASTAVNQDEDED